MFSRRNSTAMSCCTRSTSDFAHEAAVDLDSRQRKPGQITERRIAGAEIVKRDADTFFVELAQGFGGILMIERAVLGDFDLKAFRR